MENGSLDYLMRENLHSRELELVGVRLWHFQFVLTRDSAISDTAGGCWSSLLCVTSLMHIATAPCPEDYPSAREKYRAW